MAVDLGNGTVRVVRGDNLWNIAKTYLGNGARYQELASWNGIKNPNLIYAGQIIKLSPSGGGGGGGSASSAPAPAPSVVSNLQMGILATKDDTLFASWSWGRADTTASYELEWTYTYDNVTWLIELGTNSVNEHNRDASLQVTKTVFAGARKVRLRVKPVATKSGETYPWTAGWSGYQTWSDTTPVETPPVPSVKIEKYKLTAELTGLDTLKATHIKFQVYKDNSILFQESGQIAITTTKTASYSCDVEAGGEYQVRCKAYNGTDESDWCAFSGVESTIPSAPSGFISVVAESKTSVRLKWEAVTTAEKYDIEYTTESKYFDISDQTTPKNDLEGTEALITGLETGKEYFFRIRSTNDKGASAWSEASSVIIGVKPSAPTTWSSTTTVIVGEPLTLYWVHNAVDGSSQEQAELELTINGVLLEPSYTIKNVTDEDKKDKTTKVIVNTHATTYIKTDTVIEAVEGMLLDNTTTTTGELVYYYKNGDTTIYYCVVNSVYYSVTTKPSALTISWVDDTGTQVRSTGYSPVEGMKIQWRVRTKGIYNEYGDWSVQRTVDLYAPPTLALDMFDVKTSTDEEGKLIYVPGDRISTLTSFPFYIYALPGPKTQSPIGYHLSIKANESYTTVDQIGNEKTINKGGEVYSKFFDITDSLLVELTPGVIDLENGINYTVTCIVTMNSGLTAEASREFFVSWTEEKYAPNAVISYDTETYVTHIRPYCEEFASKWYKVSENSKKFTVTTEVINETILSDVYTSTYERVLIARNTSGSIVYYCIVYTDNNGNPIDPVYYRVTVSDGVYTKSTSKLNSSTLSTVYAETGEEVLLGSTTEGESFFYSIVKIANLVDGITLSVYRREYDGSFTEIMTGLSNTKQTFTTDPHPALDYARYRIVAVEDATGSISYYDVPGLPIQEKGVIIQWDEKWTEFDVDVNEELAQPPWTGSLIRIPYNINVANNNSPDVTLVQYIGRKHPVSYYGTYIGEKANWSVEIPKEDKDMLYALRRLSLWMGDVYVREPSGSGYWANIKVSFSQTHCEVTIPVTFDITRVEGGV